MEVTNDEMREMPPGSIVVTGCRNCEGAEEHTKLEGGKWECKWCGHVEIDK
ncbi:hypothetical protein P4H65_24005 [Paenibacillus chitinolyticus]|uniref:hypothetical protein n=1 Tax=Paenibacillus chitinolyticus TaxID=79263 RepID=UPI002DBBB7DE|nr:hypothetical protein [Paenibacillus chitinolyticus]MEC0248861.1 hypothetical protein [Paenibacillus chitinolyticus]